MNRRSAIRLGFQIVGTLMVAAGLLIGSTLFLPFAETGSEGLYRTTSNGSTQVVYGTVDTFYSTSAEAVAGIAAFFIVLGSTVVLVASRPRCRTP
jgi:hypothetical protein